MIAALLLTLWVVAGLAVAVAVVEHRKPWSFVAAALFGPLWLSIATNPRAMARPGRRPSDTTC